MTSSCGHGQQSILSKIFCDVLVSNFLSSFFFKLWWALGAYQPPQTPHSYICLGFHWDPLGGHIIKPSFPLVFPVTFCLIFQHSAVCFQMPFNAHLLVAHTNSYCCHTHQSFDIESLELYCNNPNQLSQGVWALQPNITWYR